MNYSAYPQTNSSIPDSDVKYYLRKLDFPACAKEALVSIANLSRMTGSTVRQQIQLQTDLMIEFVFGEVDKLKQQKKPESLQEFQLIEVLSDFFRDPDRSPAVRNAVFLFLFPGECPRYEILGTLVSLSISTQNRQVLDSTGMWMQQLGSTSVQSVDLAKHILNDFFVFSPNSIDKLKQLPVLVPYFTANLLTAIGEVYKFQDPPNELLKLVGDWIDDNPGLLTTSLMDNPALPSGGIPMTPITPIAGLFRWCILSSARKEPADIDKSITDERKKLYSKIQQLLMDAVLRLKDTSGNKHAISAQHLAQTTRTLTSLLEQTDSSILKASCDLAMERLAQAVSTALSVNCIYGNKQELLALLQPLACRHFLIEWTLMTYGSKVPVV
ncbi:integrator complex subunit 15 [Microplitis mediator]|uniref:integrator complex subunit 15 n=1 Tax=Microplitis mediator TaxID=375433 RepID=UPI002556C447|nr:integrator complex subunit 15 [Microplitis mediator]